MSSKQPPAERASELIESVPASNIVSKTGAIVLGTGLAATAISQELYVVNEETVILAGFAILATIIARSAHGPYSEWARGQIDKIKGILNQSRAEHTQAVKDRINSVEQMKDVVGLTKGLFALSKETVQLEAEIFEQRQRVAMAAELKSVLDSWVRYEQQAKEAEQAELAKSVIDKVLKSLSDERAQKDILLSAVTEVEQLVKNKAI
ncbi:ATP synthase subunit 4, mitochondrial Flags: Precursor [Serendipita indica DSM 11827]|uniref:ATP synthase subunit 4 n=1 Tax=Serendipita indica (strain DSM 11827) TaxID=1109443 RepID=G4TPN6_SERID|nr:ATP synthase subunit 4, mitochondrial Flags: Precursor [Serendipita indica DSM 11827]CCA73281.1 probable H+-transporting two-sector ATPase chain b precursor, mitochondrial [Serendipita indica DSM 11827]